MSKKVILNPQKNKPNKKILFSILIICLIISFVLISFVLIPVYLKEKEEKEYQELISRAKVVVNLKEDTTIPFYSNVKVSDFITEINGELIDDYKIDTTKLGEQKINFEYINEEGIKIPYSYKITVEDETAPVIWLGNTKSITTEYEGNLLDDITCADNYDDNPKCEIIGEYNTKKVGKYKLTFKATDSSGNETTKDFTLNVKEPAKSSSSSSSSTPSKKTYFTDIVAKHKNENTKIGIDVSSWQGDIDFEKVKNAGVEFVIIRVGSTRGIDGEYFIDKKFQANIEGFNQVGIPVGIYFYSYANSYESAIRDANWVIDQIKDYEVDLPIAYDWESWSFYNDFNQSFYSLSMTAKSFLDTVKQEGYDGLLYSSKSYLEDVWFDIGYDVWLANYTTQTKYQGPYKYWQLCSNGRVDGIKGNVDINVMYN